MFQKLDDVEKRFEELNKKISDPEVISNTSEWQKLMKEHAAIIDVVEIIPETPEEPEKEESKKTTTKKTTRKTTKK